MGVAGKAGLWSFVALAWLAPLMASASVRLPAVLGDNMVLQRGAETPIWGWANPGESVSVTLNGQTVRTRADEKGEWKVALKDLRAGGPFEMTVAGDNTLTLRNVLVGEVWVCSGQSNMEWPTSLAVNGQREAAAADLPQVRLLTVPKRVAVQPLPDMEASWVVCSPQTVGSFSAVGFFFGRELHRELGVPVGLINTSWGGTPAESWTPRTALVSDRDFLPIVQRWERLRADYPQAKANYPNQLQAWEKAAADARAAGRPEPPKPQEPQDPVTQAWWPSGLYNAMIAPLVPFGIQGAIWYQGESNADRAYQYRTLFPTMIKEWRKAWGRGDFPFLYVQLANFMPVKPEPTEDAWAELREAQTMTLSLPKTGMASAIDIGEAADIHPRNKQEVGRRLALAAQAIAYGRSLPYSGPLYQSMDVKGNRAVLSFKHADGGLQARNGELKGFAIAGPDRWFVWAQARIVGDRVELWSDQVPHPVAVRYAWAINPIGNLYNGAGLPAVPFRTDSWPGLTVDAR